MSTPLEHRPFWASLVADARRKPLRQVARTYGTTVAELQEALLRTDVLGARPPQPTKSSGSRRFPRSETSASSARTRIEAVAAFLGVEPDGAVARRAGVARKTIVEFRKARGIPAYRGEPASVTDARSAALRGSRLDAYADIIGVLPDREVAERAGVTAENVRMYRARRGISAGWRVVPRPEAASSPAVPAATSAPPASVGAATVPEGPVYAWRVNVVRADGDRRMYGVFAAELLDAVRRAEAALSADGWSVEGICRIGEALRPQ